MKKKVLSVLMSVAMMSTLLAGCGSSADSADAPAADSSESGGDAAATSI